MTWISLSETTERGDSLTAAIPPDYPVATVGYRGSDDLVLNLGDIPALRRLLDRIELGESK
jgi:hypothetical protein